ncbi:MAG: NAD(P)/FAD-dependent oxidoreductase [Clostridiales bacterium]|nr:NAD(P)/FAD-dependent oxidoreductase [Clostridiales bacterium]
MKGNIIIVGGNQGALVLAYRLGKAGFNVTVFDKKEQSKVAYDWHDCMVPEAFDYAGIPFPPEDCLSPKRCWTFISPKKTATLYVNVPEEKLDIAVERRPLNDYLYTLAKEYADIRYETAVSGIIVGGNRVKGVVLKSGEKVYADLVVDSSGALSNLRASLPEDWGIERIMIKKDAFFVYRGIFNVVENTAPPEYTNNVYMKHMDEPGISWFIYDEEKMTADVLIGRVGSISDETIDRALKDIKKDHPQIGDTVVRDCQKAVIPVRRPISKMFANGYVLIGDSAFMTVPMMGSGIACGFMAAKILTDVLSYPMGDPFGESNLYRYQVGYMREIGAKHTGISMMKNWMLSAPTDAMDDFMAKRVIGEKELEAGGSGHSIQLSVGEIMQKALKSINHLPTLLDLKKMIDKMTGVMDLAENLPDEYEKNAFEQWQRQYDGMFKRSKR